MKTGAFWAIASAFFLIASAFMQDNVLHIVAIAYSFLAVIKAGIES